MSLKIRVKNLGILKHAEFSLGDLTIICGGNNTGKTYATYALYGFLRAWGTFIPFPISDAQIQSLLTDGILTINLAQYIKRADQMLAEACERYTAQLDTVFAAPEDLFLNSEFRILTGKNNLRDIEYEGALPHDSGYPPLTCWKKKGSEELTFASVAGKKLGKETFLLPIADIVQIISSNVLFANYFPNPFIVSAERTGVATFRKELNSGRNRLLEEMGRADKRVDLRELLSRTYQSYPLPIRDNVEFTSELEDVAKTKSFIAKEHPEVLEDFADIIGGDYDVTQNDQIYYIPKGTRRKLTMLESSSAVRSLLDLGFYLRCIARKGDILIVDEPELNLHPANQRRIARLFARLVNVGVKVFITTHSDYILKELNTLIMLNHDDMPHLKRIAEENGYQQTELIKAAQVKVYMAKEELLPLEEGQKRRRRGLTFVPADIHPRFGIEVNTFDDTIDEMNRIQGDIIWAKE